MRRTTDHSRSTKRQVARKYRSWASVGMGGREGEVLPGLGWLDCRWWLWRE